MMRYLLFAFLLTSCTLQAPRLQDPPAQVYANEYIISAQADWVPWTKGLRSASVYPKGIYVIKQEGNKLIVSGNNEQISGISSQGTGQTNYGGMGQAGIPQAQTEGYDPAKEKEVCKEIQTEGVTCGANFLMRAY